MDSRQIEKIRTGATISALGGGLALTILKIAAGDYDSIGYLALTTAFFISQSPPAQQAVASGYNKLLNMYKSAPNSANTTEASPKKTM